jgi:hypothetical protein
MQVGDLVRCIAQKSELHGKTGVITHVRRNSMNSSDKWATYYVYWSDFGYVGFASNSELEVINASR